MVELCYDCLKTALTIDEKHNDVYVTYYEKECSNCGKTKPIVVKIEKKQNRLLTFFNKLPAIVCYIIFLILLGLFAFYFPRLSLIVGYLYQYGIYAFFGLLVIGLTIYYIIEIFTKKK